MKNFLSYARFSTLFIFVFFITNHLQAQNLPVSIKIVNSKKEPVAFASIKIISVPDTVNTQQKFSDSSGVASFNLLQDHLYKIEATAINYKPIQKTINLSGTQSVFTLVAEDLDKTLDQVM